MYIHPVLFQLILCKHMLMIISFSCLVSFEWLLTQFHSFCLRQYLFLHRLHQDANQLISKHLHITLLHIISLVVMEIIQMCTHLNNAEHWDSKVVHYVFTIVALMLYVCVYTISTYSVYTVIILLLLLFLSECSPVGISLSNNISFELTYLVKVIFGVKGRHIKTSSY